MQLLLRKLNKFVKAVKTYLKLKRISIYLFRKYFIYYYSTKMMAVHRLAFIGEWFQQEAEVTRVFYIYFDPSDSAVEIFDQKTKKMFLKRTPVNGLTEKDFFIGAKVNIFGRQIEIVDYGDSFTKSKLAGNRKKTFMLIRDRALKHMGTILNTLIENDFCITKGRMVQFNTDCVRMFFLRGKDDDVEITNVVSELVSRPSCGFELRANNAVEVIKMCSDVDVEQITTEWVGSTLRTLFDDQDIREGVYYSKTDEEADWEINSFFDPGSCIPTNAVFNNSTLAVIKPHVIKEGKLGRIISEILNNGFTITALKMEYLDRINCEEFFEVYKGVLPEYGHMVNQLASGMCMALEIVSVHTNRDTHAEFRNFCGPMDPDIAKEIRPHSLRAKFGQTKVLNAIHCTDLPEDTKLEIEYFFKILCK